MKRVWKSGTSFAVPIAVAFAADILEFANYKCNNLSKRKRKLLRQKNGMEAVLQKMTEGKRDGYDFIYPANLWGKLQDAKTERQAAKAIEDIMGKL